MNLLPGHEGSSKAPERPKAETPKVSPAPDDARESAYATGLVRPRQNLFWRRFCPLTWPASCCFSILKRELHYNELDCHFMVGDSPVT